MLLKRWVFEAYLVLALITAITHFYSCFSYYDSNLLPFIFGFNGQ